MKPFHPCVVMKKASGCTLLKSSLISEMVHLLHQLKFLFSNEIYKSKAVPLKFTLILLLVLTFNLSEVDCAVVNSMQMAK